MLNYDHLALNKSSSFVALFLIRVINVKNFALKRFLKSETVDDHITNYKFVILARLTQFNTIG